jgi:lipoate-protein ligase A
MGEMWRVVDTGLRSAAQNIALDRALLEARHAEEIPSTLRFARFAPSVLLACGQSAAPETDLDYCNASNIAVQRRITGGDAMYCDRAQLGWALYLHRRDVDTLDMRANAKRICHAAAAAVGALGMDARFRGRHDIEVDGRKIGGTGGACDGDALLYQGILQIDLDMASYVRAMRTPACERAVAAARERVTDLTHVLGGRPDAALVRRNLIAAFESEFAVEFHDGDLSLTEHARYQRALAEIETADWTNLLQQPGSDVSTCAATLKLAYGVLHAGVVYDRAAHRIKQVWFTHDETIRPRRVIADLEAALSDTSVERLERNVTAFFAGRTVDMPALIAGDFASVVRRALNLPLVARHP